MGVVLANIELLAVGVADRPLAHGKLIESITNMRPFWLLVQALPSTISHPPRNVLLCAEDDVRRRLYRHNVERGAPPTPPIAATLAELESFIPGLASGILLTFRRYGYARLNALSTIILPFFSIP